VVATAAAAFAAVTLDALEGREVVRLRTTTPDGSVRTTRTGRRTETVPCGWRRSILALLLGALLVWPTVARIHAEEALLRSHFGAPYDDYRARTWRLVPFVY
jgi:hypothetical protein